MHLKTKILKKAVIYKSEVWYKIIYILTVVSIWHSNQDFQKFLSYHLRILKNHISFMFTILHYKGPGRPSCQKQFLFLTQDSNSLGLSDRTSNMELESVFISKIWILPGTMISGKQGRKNTLFMPRLISILCLTTVPLQFQLPLPTLLLLFFFIALTAFEGDIEGQDGEWGSQGHVQTKRAWRRSCNKENYLVNESACGHKQGTQTDSHFCTCAPKQGIQ